MAEFLGKCQCGRVAVSLITASPDSLQPRACGCSFCRRHGAHTVSDPSGRVTVTAEVGALHRHQFGMRSADFLICVHCGVYIGALANLSGVDYAAINAVGVDFALLAARPPVPVDVENESREERDTRRRRTWTPATVVELDAAVAAD